MITRTICEPVLAHMLEDLKVQLSITGTDLDARLSQCLRASIKQAESFLGFKVAYSSVTQKEPFSSSLALLSPVAGVESVLLYTDGQGVSSEEWHVESDQLIFDGGVTADIVEINYYVGSHVIEMEEDITQAIYMRAASLFEHPSDQVDQYQRASVNLLRPHRRWK